jgi:S1-C subfamily serine protease
MTDNPHEEKHNDKSTSITPESTDFGHRCLEEIREHPIRTAIGVVAVLAIAAEEIITRGRCLNLATKTVEGLKKIENERFASIYSEAVGLVRNFNCSKLNAEIGANKVPIPTFEYKFFRPRIFDKIVDVGSPDARLYELGKSIVRIRGERQGTGFIVDPSGIIATSYHVVKGSPKIKSLAVDIVGQGTKIAQVIARDRNADLCLLKVESPPGGYPVLKLGDSQFLKKGQKLFGIGHLAGNDKAIVTSGQYLRHASWTCFDRLASPNESLPDTVSAIWKQRSTGAAVRTNLETMAGTSGSPFLTANGEVVGIHYGGRHEPGGCSWGPSVEHLKFLLQTTKEKGIGAGWLNLRSDASIDGTKVTVRALTANVRENPGVVSVQRDSPLIVSELTTQTKNKSHGYYEPLIIVPQGFRM